MQRFAYQESCPYQARRCTLRRPPARSRTPSGCSSTQKHTRAIRRHRHIEQPPTVLTARRPATQSTFVHSVDQKHIFRLHQKHQKHQKHIGIGRRRNHPNLFVFGKSLYQSGGLSRLYIVEKERLRFVRWTARGINIPPLHPREKPKEHAPNGPCREKSHAQVVPKQSAMPPRSSGTTRLQSQAAAPFL